MKPHTRSILGLIFIFLFAGVFLYGAGSTYYWQRSGTPAMASVTSCTKVRRAYVCRGSWMVDGKLTLGMIENAGPSDRGQRIPVRVKGDRAIIPGLRLPIILLVIGAGIAALGIVWWVKEAPRNREAPLHI